MGSLRHVLAIREYRELPEQQVPLLDDVCFVEGPGEPTPPHMKRFVADQDLVETEIPRRGLGFVVEDRDGRLVGRTYDAQQGEWV